MRLTLSRRAALALLALPFAATAALAHHGWAWTTGEDFTLSGTITEIYLGNPHARLGVKAADGDWAVELAPPSRTAAAGFVEGVAKVGDTVEALGERSKDLAERRMKAERITIGGKSYDVYPDRLPAS